MPYLLCVLLAGGCAVGPNFKAPDAHPPAAFRGADEAGTNSLGDLAWWQLFQDPALQDLIRSALTNNYDLRLAAARVEESRALLAQSRSVFYPQVTYQAATGADEKRLSAAPHTTPAKAPERAMTSRETSLGRLIFGGASGA